MYTKKLIGCLLLLILMFALINILTITKSSSDVNESLYGVELLKELNKSFALLWTFIFKLVEKIDKITDVLNELVDEADEKSRIIEAIKTEMTNMKKEVYDYIVQMLEEGGEDNADANGEKQN